jgi:hypothetical protein
MKTPDLTGLPHHTKEKVWYSSDLEVFILVNVKVPICKQKHSHINLTGH